MPQALASVGPFANGCDALPAFPWQPTSQRVPAGRPNPAGFANVATDGTAHFATSATGTSPISSATVTESAPVDGEQVDPVRESSGAEVPSRSHSSSSEFPTHSAKIRAESTDDADPFFIPFEERGSGCLQPGEIFCGR